MAGSAVGGLAGGIGATALAVGAAGLSLPVSAGIGLVGAAAGVAAGYYGTEFMKKHGVLGAIAYVAKANGHRCQKL